MRRLEKTEEFFSARKPRVLMRPTGAGVFLLLISLAVASSAVAAQPVLKELQPRGGQRGKTFTLTMKGEGLAPGAEVITTLPGTLSRLAPPKDQEKPESELPFLVELPEDAPVGLYPLRVRTLHGLSNVLLFCVGDLPEAPEKEPNDSVAEAQAISGPVTISGTLKGPDQDFYRLRGRAQQRLVVEVEARRAGSAIDPVVEVLDPKGRRLALSDDAPGLGADARVEVTFPREGSYYVLVHDSKFSDQTEQFYRLKVGAFPYAEGIFPLGWQRGKSVEVAFFGGNLKRPGKLRMDLAVPPGTETIPIHLPGAKPSGMLPLHFRVGDLPETLEPAEGSRARLEPSTVMNGRISKPGEIDRYHLKVSAGQRWLLDLEAASLGTSQLFGSLGVYDLQGKRLTTQDVGSPPDPKLAFEVPGKVEEVVLAVEDLRGLGGWAFAYRLLARPQPEDFSLRLHTPYVNVPAGGTAAIEVVAERHGYSGPIRVTIPALPEDLVVEGGNLHAEFAHYTGIRQLSTRGYLTLTAKPGAPPRAVELSVWGEGVSAAGPIRRRAQGPGMMVLVGGGEVLNQTGDLVLSKPLVFPWLGLELPLAISKAMPVSLEIAKRIVRVVQGIDYPIEWKLVKQGPGIVPRSISASLPYGEIKDLSVRETPESKGKDEGKVVVSSSFDTPLAKLDVVLSANVQINGKDERVTSPALTVEVVRGYSVALATDRLELKSGGKAELGGTIRREPTFSGTVKIGIDDPPAKVNCPAVEVADGKEEFLLVCEAAPGAETGDFEIHVASSAVIPGRKDKREYRIPPLTARLVVSADRPTVAATKDAR